MSSSPSRSMWTGTSRRRKSPSRAGRTSTSPRSSPRTSGSSRPARATESRLRRASASGFTSRRPSPLPRSSRRRRLRTSCRRSPRCRRTPPPRPARHTRQRRRRTRAYLRPSRPRRGRSLRRRRRRSTCMARSRLAPTGARTTRSSCSSSRPYREPTHRMCSSLRPASSSRTRAAQGTPSRCFFAASTRTRGRTWSSASTASPSTTRATTTATATQTHTSSSPSSFNPCASSRAPTRLSKATSPWREARTTTSASTVAASPPSTRRGTSTRSASCFSGARATRPRAPSPAPSSTRPTASAANRQGKRGTAVAQYEIPTGDHAVLRINASAYLTEYNNAGVVREDDYDAGRVGFYGTEDPNQTGNTGDRFSLSATYEARFHDIDVSQQLFAIDRNMRLPRKLDGLSRGRSAADAGAARAAR